MQYKNSKICKGASVKYKPCEYIDTCKICTKYAFDKRQGNNNELYRVFNIALACKRDNPNFKPYKISDLKDFDKNNPEHIEKLQELIDFGIVKE